MSGLIEGARRLLTREGTDIGKQIEGLQTAAQAARGRLDDNVVDRCEGVAHRAAERLRLSADHTVVAIAGATGSGKSSTFNALTGLELSSVGVRRPTTSWATACVWGQEGAAGLLDWLEIPPRHQTMRDSMLDTRRHDVALDGVVLLDLPDHDSTEVSHHLEVDRLVQMADLLIWVLDPQKYADAAIHDRYLAPLKSHAGVMLVVLNHIDSVAEDRREAMLGDVRRLLDADGLSEVPLLAVSARHNIGIEELRHEIISRVDAKKATRARMQADLVAAAADLAAEGGRDQPRGLSDRQLQDLDQALAESAGVPTVVDAVERSTRLRAGRATGWPVVSWLSRLKPDPLKRLHLDLGSAGRELTGSARTSMPETGPVQRARVDTEVRLLADEAATGLARPWADSVRRASTSRVDDLGDSLDRVLGATDLGTTNIPAWAGVVRALQWALIVTAVAGLLWLGGIATFGYLGLPEIESPRIGVVPVPTLMLVGGVVLGVLLAFFCRFLVGITARRRASAADKRLRAAVHDVATELVATPIEAELAAYEAYRGGLTAALH
ncbi:50S ribosome-binding GTPase [Nocardioides salsibiostraticola]